MNIIVNPAQTNDRFVRWRRTEPINIVILCASLAAERYKNKKNNIDRVIKIYNEPT